MSPNSYHRETIGRILALMLAFCSTGANARDIHVDPIFGSDASDGSRAEPSKDTGPVRSIAKAIKLAEPGDVVHLAKTPEPYRESPVFHNRHGEVGRPIVLDGHGATVSGAERVDLSQWEQLEPGLYRNTKLLKTNEAIIGRWFFRINGRMQHMGRSSKGPSLPLKSVAELQAGEWTFVATESAFYIKLDPAKSPSEISIDAPIRSSGVQVSGDCSHLVIRNLTATHVHNDGFNIHGKCRDVLFENVRAIECGDDGISAHDDCRIRVDGLESIGNSTGFCHTNDSHSDSHRVLIRDCIGFDVFVLNSGRHRLTNSLILSAAAQSISVHGDQKKNEQCSLELSHVAIQRQPSSRNPYVRFYENSDVVADHCTFSGFHFVVTGRSLALTNCVVGGTTLASQMTPELNISAHVKWMSQRNLFDVSQLRIGTATYRANQFANYQQASRQDSQSKIAGVRFAQPFTGRIDEPDDAKTFGADPQKLPSAQ